MCVWWWEGDTKTVNSSIKLKRNFSISLSLLVFGERQLDWSFWCHFEALESVLCSWSLASLQKLDERFSTRRNRSTGETDYKFAILLQNTLPTHILALFVLLEPFLTLRQNTKGSNRLQNPPGNSGVKFWLVRWDVSFKTFRVSGLPAGST